MDGSAASFLLESPFLSDVPGGKAGGILYIDDFDILVAPDRSLDVTPACTDAATPLITTSDLKAAREDGYTEGMQAALTDAQLVQSQLLTAALQGVTDALRAERAMLEKTARSQAASCVRVILAVLQSAVPFMMAEHAECEADAMVRALVPELAHEPELKVRAHPVLAEPLRETLAECLSDHPIVLSVAADERLAAGDVHVSWQDGQARRDCKSIWNQIRAALVRLNLPSLEEVCLVNRS